MGFDAGGNELSSVMPRFQLTMRDAADLIAYLRKLGETVDPGLTASTVRLGVLLPQEQTVKNKQLVRQAMLHYFASVNGAGGVFGRAIETSFTELPSDTARQSAAILDFLHDQHVFAVLGDFTGAEPEIAAVMLKTATPAIAAIAPSPQTDSPLNRYVFYLDGGVTEQRNASDLKSADQRNWERATAAAEIITEAMTRAGRALTRGGLVQALEGFSNGKPASPRPSALAPTDESASAVFKPGRSIPATLPREAGCESLSAGAPHKVNLSNVSGGIYRIETRSRKFWLDND